MGRRRKKDKALTPLLSAEELSNATEELAAALFGQSPLGRLASKVAGRLVYRKAGGRTNTARQPPSKQQRVKVIKLPNGIEYFPPPKKESST